MKVFSETRFNQEERVLTKKRVFTATYILLTLDIGILPHRGAALSLARVLNLPASCQPPLILFHPTNPIQHMVHALWTLSSSSNSDHPSNVTNPGRGLILFPLIYVLCIDCLQNLVEFGPNVKNRGRQPCLVVGHISEI